MILTVASRIDSVVRFFVVLFIFLFVCVLTYFGTRFIATVQKGQMNCTNIDVVETFRIAPNKYVQIIRIADEYVAICVCKDTVTFLTKVDKGQLELMPEKTVVGTAVFKDILEKAKLKANTMKGEQEDK